jgi:hypothetical protein
MIQISLSSPCILCLLPSKGPIVRIGPNAISISSVSALKEIYGNRRANVQKSQWYHIIDASTGDHSTHSVIDRTKHASRRRVLDHAFSDSALRSAEAFIVDNVKNFCQLIASGPSSRPKNGNDVEKTGSSSWSAAKNMSTWSTYLNYDIMGDLVFGKRFNCMTSDEHRFVPPLLMNGMAFVYSVRPTLSPNTFPIVIHTSPNVFPIKVTHSTLLYSSPISPSAPSSARSSPRAF